MSSINIKEGSIVIARMPISESELNKMEESHQIRPFIIYMVDQYKYYGFTMSSSVKKNKRKRPICLVIPNVLETSDLYDKRGVVLLDRIWALDESNILNVVGKITKEQYYLISKRILLIKDKLRWYSFALKLYQEKYYHKQKYESGDIIFSNDDQNIYLIYDIYGSKIIAYKVNICNEEKLDSFLINKKHYLIDYTTSHNLDLSKNSIQYVCSISIPMFLKIKEHIKIKRKQVPKVEDTFAKEHTVYTAYKDTYQSQRRNFNKLETGMKISYFGEEYIILSVHDDFAYMINALSYRENLIIEKLEANSYYEIVGSVSDLKLLEIDLFLERQIDSEEMKKVRYLCKKK